MSASRRKTDKQGRFDIPGRVPGKHDFHIDEKILQSIDLVEGETKDITIEVPATQPSP